MTEPYALKITTIDAKDFEKMIELRNWCHENIHNAIPNDNTIPSDYASRLEYQGWCFKFDVVEDAWVLLLKDPNYASVISLML